MLTWLRSVKVSTKVVAALVWMAVGGSAVSLYVAHLTSEVGTTVQATYAASFGPLASLLQASEGIHGYRARVQGHLLERAEARKATLETELRERAARVDEALRVYGEAVTGGAEQDELSRTRAAWTQHVDAVAAKVLPASRAGKTDEAVAALATLNGGLEAVVGGTGQLLSLNTEAGKAGIARASDIAGTSHWVAYLALVGGILTALAIGLVLTQSIVNPIDRMVTVLQSVATGKLTQQIDVSGRDEVGVMASSLGTAVDSLRKVMREIAENAGSMATASEQVAKVSEQMAGTSEETSSQANLVSVAADQVSKNISTVATATEEMTSTVKGIAKSVAEASRVANSAVETTKSTDATIAKLGQSSAEIGKVVKVITSIAQQTKLLALNATIEAARAGEAGKGFAVVANEVKELAKETARATEDIGHRIEAIQADSQSAVVAITEIGTVVRQISDIQNSISAAVEEQAATTSEIDRNVTEAAKASSEIAQNIMGVAEAATAAASGAVSGQKAAGNLAHMAEALQKMLGNYQF